jgi:hypothetical protein
MSSASREATSHVGTAAPGYPVECSSTAFAQKLNLAERRSAGQPGDSCRHAVRGYVLGVISEPKEYSLSGPNRFFSA